MSNESFLQEADQQHRQEIDRKLHASQSLVREKELHITELETKCSDLKRKLHQVRHAAFR